MDEVDFQVVLKLLLIFSPLHLVCKCPYHPIIHLKMQLYLEPVHNIIPFGIRAISKANICLQL